MKIEKTETNDPAILKDERDELAAALEILAITGAATEDAIKDALRAARRILF
jgi:hypothetical protein